MAHWPGHELARKHNLTEHTYLPQVANPGAFMDLDQNDHVEQPSDDVLNVSRA